MRWPSRRFLAGRLPFLGIHRLSIWLYKRSILKTLPLSMKYWRSTPKRDASPPNFCTPPF